MKKVSKPLGAGLLIVAVLLMILFIFAQTAQLPSGSGDDNFWYVLAGCIILTATLCTLVFFTLSRQQNPSPVTPDGENNPNEESASDQYDFSALSRNLRRRHSFFWRRKVRLLLITGDEAAIEQLVPGLQQQQWLEGNRTVLIYGGSLASEPDREKYTALRKLRRGRPLDGIIRVLPESLKLTPHISDSDLRGLEKISELLRYSAPVWLWQLCSSHWSQGTRPEQAVGASFPPRAKEDDVIRQLELMLPALRTQGMSQVAENSSHDFLLRLSQHLNDGAIARWAQQLQPWLFVSQQRVPLRGLMFSLSEKKPAGMSAETADAENYGSQRHALTLPATWQGIVDDCTRIRGRRVGMPWERAMAWTLMAIISVWGVGTLLSFAVNRSQIVSVAQQAHALVDHPSVSDYQLTALHALRNDAGRLLHHIQDGTPWYQRFGLNHDQQLLDAMLPWYGVANNRLIRDPANEALKQKLIALVNSAPNSDQRTQMSPRLEADLHRINFYRLCQLLEKRNPGRPLMGSTSHPGDDPVRFAPHPGMGFPASELKAVEYDEDDDSRPPRIRTTFMGMYGVDSPLPMAYLDDIAQRREGHDALQGFLDIFSHRILTQFYRIWRKYSYPATFEPGGTDSISQSLLGLVGLGIPGTADHIATPVSRFLALLGVLQQPGKTQEGMQALVTLLAPDTTVKVSPYCLRPVEMGQPLGFYGDDDFLLDGNTPLGDEAMDAGSQLLVALTTDNEQEAQGWKPDGLLYQDFLVMLCVWLGWRFKAKITLTTRTRLLAVPPLGEGPFWLGMNGVLGADEGELKDDIPPTFTTELGYYTGLKPAIPQQGNRRVTYKFD